MFKEYRKNGKTIGFLRDGDRNSFPEADEIIERKTKDKNVLNKMKQDLACPICAEVKGIDPNTVSDSTVKAMLKLIQKDL